MLRSYITNDPLYQDIKNYFDRPLPELEMTTPDKVEEAKKRALFFIINGFALRLMRYRLQLIGKGSNSVVFKDPEAFWLFKIVRADPDYLKFAQFARARVDDPHLPLIRNIFKINDDSYIIRLEHLKPLEIETGLVEYLEFGLSLNDLNDEEKTRITEKYPRLLSTLADLEKHIGYPVELNMSNVMQGGMDPVIIYPSKCTVTDSEEQT